MTRPALPTSTSVSPSPLKSTSLGTAVVPAPRSSAAPPACIRARFTKFVVDQSPDGLITLTAMVPVAVPPRPSPIVKVKESGPV